MPYGFVPGSFVPDSPKIEWYSPAYGCERKPVERLSETEFVVKTPEHTLLGTKEGNRWVMSIAK